MTKEEKELKIFRIENMIIQRKELLRNNLNTNKELTEISIEALQTLLNFLQLPTRTIETLEVGDYVEFLHDTGNYIGYDDEEGLEEIKGFINQIDKNDEEEMDGIWINEEKYYLDEFYDEPKIIPHQALTLIKEVMK